MGRLMSCLPPRRKKDAKGVRLSVGRIRIRYSAEGNVDGGSFRGCGFGTRLGIQEPVDMTDIRSAFS